MYGIIIRDVRSRTTEIEWVGESLADVYDVIADLSDDEENIFERYQVIKSVGEEVWTNIKTIINISQSNFIK